MDPNTVPKDQPFTMRAAANSDVHKLASAMYHALKDHPSVIVRCLGGGPTQQAAKAIAITSGRMYTEGFDVNTRVSLVDDPQPDGKKLTVLCFTVTKSKLGVA